jgi:hypothetical protein
VTFGDDEQALFRCRAATLRAATRGKSGERHAAVGHVRDMLERVAQSMEPVVLKAAPVDERRGAQADEATREPECATTALPPPPRVPEFAHASAVIATRVGFVTHGSSGTSGSRSSGSLAATVRIRSNEGSSARA